MTVAAILRSKGSDVATIAPDATVETAVASLAAKRIGALVVSLDGRTGIISIGDVVKRRLDNLESESSAMREYIAGR